MLTVFETLNKKVKEGRELWGKYCGGRERIRFLACCRLRKLSLFFPLAHCILIKSSYILNLSNCGTHFCFQ